MQKKYKAKTLSLDIKLIEELDRLRKSDNRSFSNYVETVLLDYVQSNKIVTDNTTQKS